MSYGTATFRYDRVDRRALADVRFYLRAWRRWCDSWRPRLGYPTSVPYMRLMRPVVAWDSESDQSAEIDELAEQVDTDILHAIDACVADLPQRKRAAIRLIYLREIPPAVRLSMAEMRRQCEQAEHDLIPMLRRKNVLLGNG